MKPSLAEAVLDGGGTVIGTTRSGKADLAVADGWLTLLALEITNDDQNRRIVEQAHTMHGRLDVAPNNAGSRGTTEPWTGRRPFRVLASHQ